MPHYRLHGKIWKPLSLESFVEQATKIKNKKHLAFSAMLFYTGLRKMELLRGIKEQYAFQEGLTIFDVGPRLKTKQVTAPLEIPNELPFMEDVKHVVQYTRKAQRVFPFSPKTAYNIINRYFNAYPHYFRLSRITNLLSPEFDKEGHVIRVQFSLPEVMSWSGHKTLSGINPYIGQANIHNIGQSLKPKEKKQ